MTAPFLAACTPATCPPAAPSWRPANLTPGPWAGRGAEPRTGPMIQNNSLK